MADSALKTLSHVSPKTGKSAFKAGGLRLVDGVSWTFAARIEPGEYRAYSRSAAVYRDKQFKRWVCAVQFDILTESLLGVVANVTWYLNLGKRDRPHAGRRCKYWSAWINANGAPPKRKNRMSHHVFEGRHARVAVVDTAKNHRQEQIEGEEAYSVIGEVLRWETGGPQR